MLRIAVLCVASAVTLLARAAAPSPGLTPVTQLEVRYLPIGAMLTWNCETDEVTGFSIERSVDGFTFEIISRVVADKGPAQSYNYLDKELRDARLYYRITAFEHGGSSSHSPLAEASALPRPHWQLTGGFSVDVRDAFDFEIEAAGVALLACELHDFLGNPVSRHEFLVQPGANRLSVPVADAAPGAYRLEVDGDGIDETIHFVKVAAEPTDAPLVRGY